MIKTVMPSGKYKSGEYVPINKDKYIGKYPILYRSSWEQQICIYLDTCKQVTEWSSESIEIPYINPIDKKQHRYYPDFYFKVCKLDCEPTMYVGEVKPYSQLLKPKKPKSTHIKTQQNYNKALVNYIVILSKMQYAKKWCEQKGLKYIFLTEKEWKQFFIS